MAEEFEDFMNIIKANDLEQYMKDLESHNLTVKDLHEGLAVLAECIVYITDFINNYFEAVANDAEDRPGMSVEAIIAARELFDKAEGFSDIIMGSLDDEEDEEEESDNDDDNG